MGVAAAAQRLGPKLVPLVPARSRPWLAKVSRPVARSIAATKYRRQYGGRFVSAIDDDDDLLHYSLEVATEPAFRYFHAARSYYAGGEWNAAEVDKVFSDIGFSLRDAGSFLEFACGWGRVTRHMVHRIDPSRITVSDISHDAVDFVTRKFGVRGFYSATTAEELDHRGRYDAIAVVSLFSHLPLHDWAPWLTRLASMVNPGGALQFSTLGEHAFAVNVSDVERDSFTSETDGFYYRGHNETRGRLSPDHYGTTYVTEAFVRSVAADELPGWTLTFCPRALMGFQDVYVLRP
jgi:2-polyprenyl-3-methyl-5-hydroxy-6-metoxy-1,4-benzoquinol methylase